MTKETKKDLEQMIYNDINGLKSLLTVIQNDKEEGYTTTVCDLLSTHGKSMAERYEVFKFIIIEENEKLVENPQT